MVDIIAEETTLDVVVGITIEDKLVVAVGITVEGAVVLPT